MLWRDWGDLFVAYQPSSAETHAFDWVTRSLLEAGKEASLTLDEFVQELVSDFDLKSEQIQNLDLTQVVKRLDELGLIALQQSDQSGL